MQHYLNNKILFYNEFGNYPEKLGRAIKLAVQIHGLQHYKKYTNQYLFIATIFKQLLDKIVTHQVKIQNDTDLDNYLKNEGVANRQIFMLVFKQNISELPLSKIQKKELSK
ncbi:hypothetical protein ACFL5G_01985 [Candidatus Margulisiibacteriota bacterium]